MIDPKFNELPPTPAGSPEDRSEVPLSAEQEAGSGSGPRTGLSINDTVASDANLSVGSRGADTSGVKAGAGAGAGGTFVSPVSSGSPAPNVVPGARGSGTTPVSARATEQSPTIREEAGTFENSNDRPSTTSSSSQETPSYTYDEVAVLAYASWCERGCPEGSPEVDWHRAEQEVRRNRSGNRTAAATA